MFRFLFSLFICILISNFAFAQNAVYSLDFRSNWNSTTHPIDYPSTAHWSSLVGTTHNNNVSFWDFGELASQGVEEVAENGDASFILQEVNTAITNGNAFEFIDLPLGFGQVFSFESISVDINFPYISLMTMLAPSPDWLGEIHNVKLTDDFGNWKSSISIEVYATDTGTDNGITYISTDDDTNPPENISSLENIAPFSDQIIATFTFSLSQILSVDETELENSISIHPNPSNDSFFIYNSGNVILENAEIFSVTGKKVKEFDNLSNNEGLNIESLRSGVYFLRLHSDKGSIVKKLIVQ